MINFGCFSSETLDDKLKLYFFPKEYKVFFCFKKAGITKPIFITLTIAIIYIITSKQKKRKRTNCDDVII